MAIASSTLLLGPLREILPSFFETEKQLDYLRTLLVTLGGALIGAAAISFSVVTFAVQMNFARMPHGLFRKLSTDWRLLGSFTGTFLLGIGVAATSLIVDPNWLQAAVLAALWGIILSLSLFLYAYRRALFLINPARQIQFIVEDARKELGAWERRFRRSKPLFESANDGPVHLRNRLSNHDIQRVAFFKANPHWTRGLQKAMDHCASFARRYAEQGDYEVSDLAFVAIANLSAAYVTTKGKTFFCITSCSIIRSRPMGLSTTLLNT